MKDTAKVSTSTFDPNPGNDEAQVATEIVLESKVTVKRTGPKEVKAGGPIVFLITATNAGPDPADPARIIDEVSPLVQKVTWTCASSCFTPSGAGNEINALAKLRQGGTFTVTVRGTVAKGAAGRSIANVARVVLPSGGQAAAPARLAGRRVQGALL